MLHDGYALSYIYFIYIEKYICFIIVLVLLESYKCKQNSFRQNVLCFSELNL